MEIRFVGRKLFRRDFGQRQAILSTLRSSSLSHNSLLLIGLFAIRIFITYNFTQVSG